MKAKITLLFVLILSLTTALNAQGKGGKGSNSDTLQTKANHNSVRSNKATIAGGGIGVVLEENKNIKPVDVNSPLSGVSKPVYHKGKLYTFTGSDAEYTGIGAACNCSGVTVRFTEGGTDCSKNCKLVTPSKK
jgi:hypothetical protein